MEDFKKVSVFERNKYSIKQLDDYHKKLRKYNYDNNKKDNFIMARRVFYKPLHGFVKLLRIFEGEKLEVLSDDRMPTDKTKIYAMTHVGKVDAERVTEALKDHFYVVSGDPDQMFRTIEHYYMLINGVFYFDVRDKEDKKITKSLIIDTLNRKENVLWCPEGAWNLTESKPVMGLHWGIIEAAKETNSVIVPIGVEIFDKTTKVKIGQNIDVNDYFNDENNDKVAKINALQDLRDQMATLKWKIWETEWKDNVNRDSISDDYYDEFVKYRVSQWPAFTKEDIESRNYQVVNGKKVYKETDVYKYLEEFEFNKSNAFLLKGEKNSINSNILQRKK